MVPPCLCVCRSTQMPFPALGSQQRFPHLGTLTSVEGLGLLPQYLCISFGRSFNLSIRACYASLIVDSMVPKYLC